MIAVSRPLKIAAVAASLTGFAAALAPVQAEVDFATFLEGVRKEALERGMKPATVNSALSGLEAIPRVIELDRRQPEFTMTLDTYLSRVVSKVRIKKGRRKLAENRALLMKVAAKYRVQPRFIVALWGIETDFGRLTGGFSVVRALATLAHDGRRSAYFRKELFNALKIIDEGHITAAKMSGSWAGAMGQNQFMPSSFLRFAVDHDGDGRVNIWTSKADVFASTANYLSGVGWRNDQTWGREVRLPAKFDTSLAGLNVRRTLPQWQAMGVRRIDGGSLPRRPLKASVMLPAGPEGRAFIVYNNYRSILKWNRAHFFATAVGRLADGIARD